MDRYWLLWLPLPVMGFMIRQVMQCLLWARVSFVLGYPPSPPFVTRVWALCGLSCPALIMRVIPGRFLTCCLFTELCHFVAVAHPLAQEFTFPPELSVNMFRDPELRQLAQALPYILVHEKRRRLCPRTWEHTSPGKHGHCGTMLPSCLWTPLRLPSMWCLLCRRRDLSAVNSAVYGVSYVHKKRGYPEVSEFLVAKQLLDAAKRILARPPTCMKPLSIDQVRSLLTRLEGGTIADLQLAALLAMGFFGFLRCDDLHHLSVDSPNFGVSHVAIFLRRHKND